MVGIMQHIGHALKIHDLECGLPIPAIVQSGSCYKLFRETFLNIKRETEELILYVVHYYSLLSLSKKMAQQVMPLSDIQ
jgi:hypothetical protein